MRLDEFQQLDLAVNFHDQLNPKLWDGDQLQPDVRRALLKIANHFKDFLGIDMFDLLDITISGSNAAYTYTSHSDIDLHLVVMIPDEHQQELEQLFNAKKYQYNDQHDIRVRGFEVELYVQDAEQKHHSMGIYSVSKNSWIQRPEKKRATINDIDVREKYQTMQHRINQAIVSNSQTRIEKVWTDVKNMRQAGLETGGEFSPENLAFKILRAEGHIEKLKKHLTDVVSHGLSIDEEDETPETPPAVAPTKNKPEVYLDMDGVLADFFSEYAVLAGLPAGSSYRDIPPAKTDPTLNKMEGTDFFARLPKFSTADSLVSMVVELFGHYHICSSPLRGDFENSEYQKRRWIKRHLNPQPRDIIITPRKEKHAVQSNGTPNILIDDRGDNITKWEAAGGIGIKYQADEDSLSTITAGIRRALKILAGEQEFVPQKLKSLDRSMPVATQHDVTEDIEIVDQDDKPFQPHEQEIRHFIDWVYANEHIKGPQPNMIFSDVKDSPGMHHTGWYKDKENTMWIYTHERNLIDIMRTVAHELTHRKQGMQGRIKGHSPPGSKLEREADDEAGYLMKLYGKDHPEIIQ